MEIVKAERLWVFSDHSDMRYISDPYFSKEDAVAGAQRRRSDLDLEQGCILWVQEMQLVEMSTILSAKELCAVVEKCVDDVGVIVHETMRRALLNLLTGWMDTYVNDTKPYRLLDKPEAVELPPVPENP